MTTQDHVNQLYDQFGSGLPFRTDYYALLRQHGLRSNDVSREMLDEAEQHTKQQLRSKFRKEPKKKIPLPKHEPPDTIIPASEEANSRRTKNMNVPEGEARQLLVAIGRDIAADQRRYPISRLEKRFNECNEQGVLTIVAESKDPGEQRLKDLLISVADAKQEGETIVIVPDGEPAEVTNHNEVEVEQNEEESVETNQAEVEATKENATMIATQVQPKRGRGRPRKNPEVNGSVKTSPVKKTKPASDDKIQRDKFGSRIGSDCAKVNALLSRKPQTEPELRRAAGVSSSVEYHLDKMVRLGILSWIEDQGYFLAKK